MKGKVLVTIGLIGFMFAGCCLDGAYWGTALTLVFVFLGVAALGFKLMQDDETPKEDPALMARKNRNAEEVWSMWKKTW
jgi:uncharacterized membrane protein